MEQLKFLPKLRLTKAQLQTIIKERDYESLESAMENVPLMVSFIR